MNRPIKINQRMIEYEIRGSRFRRFSTISGGYFWKVVCEAATPFDEEKDFFMPTTDVPHYEKLHQNYTREEKLKRILYEKMV